MLLKAQYMLEKGCIKSSVRGYNNFLLML